MNLRLFNLVFLLIVAVSGFCGLVYQVIWERLARYNFGGDNTSATIIIAVFLFGLGIGAFAFRKVQTRPLLIYGLVELGIGTFALISFPLISNLSSHLAQIIAPNLDDLSSIRVLTAAGCILFILPPCILMGGTLPLMFAGVFGRSSLSPRLLGTVYGLNIFGAMMGTLAVPYLLLNNMPIQQALYLAAAANFLIGSLAILLHFAVPERAITTNHTLDTPLEAIAFKWSLWTTFLTGVFTSVGEVLLIRHAFQMIPASPYNFAFVIGPVLLALSAGSLLIPSLSIVRRRPSAAISWLLIISASGLLFSVAVSELLISTHTLMPNLERLATTFLYFGLVCFPAFFPLGAIFPILCSLTESRLATVSNRTGMLYLLNSTGAFIGALTFNYFGSHALGGRLTIEILVLMLATSGVWLLRKSPSGPLAWVAAAAIGATIFIVPMQSFLFGPRLLTAPQSFVREGSSGVAAVTWDPKTSTGNVLVNGISMGEIPTEPKGVRQLGSALAAMPHPPRNVLVLGLGAGTFVRGLFQLPSVQSITVVDWSRELPPLVRNPDVVSRIGNTLADDRIRLISEDARMVVGLLPAGEFDLILDNLVYPTWAGATGVRSDSFFAHISHLLSSDGTYGITTNYARWRGEILAGLLHNFSSVYENQRGYMAIATNLKQLTAAPDHVATITEALWQKSLDENSSYAITKIDYRNVLSSGMRRVKQSEIAAKPFSEDRLYSEYYYTSRDLLTFLRR